MHTRHHSNLLIAVITEKLYSNVLINSYWGQTLKGKPGSYSSKC